MPALGLPVDDQALGTHPEALPLDGIDIGQPGCQGGLLADRPPRQPVGDEERQGVAQDPGAVEGRSTISAAGAYLTGTTYFSSDVRNC